MGDPFILIFVDYQTLVEVVSLCQKFDLNSDRTARPDLAEVGFVCFGTTAINFHNLIGLESYFSGYAIIDLGHLDRNRL